MKSLFLKNRISAMFFWGSIVSFALPGCQSESIEANASHENQWTGHWKITSFYHYGADIQGKVVVSSTLHFHPGPSDSNGDFEWSIIYHSNDLFEHITGSYEINESNHEITFIGNKGQLLKMHFALQDNQLALSGMHDDVPLFLKAQRSEQTVQK